MFALARLVLALFTSILLNASDVLFWALQHQADQLLREGRYEEAMPVVHAAVAEAGVSGRVGLPTAVALNDLGYLYALLGRCDDARTALLHSVNVWKKLSSAGVPGLVETGSTLVTVYLDCGDPGIAARFWTRELEPLYLRVPAGIVFARLKVIAGALSLVRREYALADQLFTAALNANEEQKSLGSNELA